MKDKMLVTLCPSGLSENIVRRCAYQSVDVIVAFLRQSRLPG